MPSEILLEQLTILDTITLDVTNNSVTKVSDGQADI